MSVSPPPDLVSYIHLLSVMHYGMIVMAEDKLLFSPWLRNPIFFCMRNPKAKGLSVL